MDLDPLQLRQSVVSGVYGQKGISIRCRRPLVVSSIELIAFDSGVLFMHREPGLATMTFRYEAKDGLASVFEVARVEPSSAVRIEFKPFTVKTEWKATAMFRIRWWRA